MDELPVLQRRPLPTRKDNGGELKSPCKKLVKVGKEKKFSPSDDDQVPLPQTFDGPYYIKVGPSPFPWRKPRQLPKIMTANNYDDKHVGVLHISTSEQDLDKLDSSYTDFDNYAYEAHKFFVYGDVNKISESLVLPEPELHLQNLNTNESVPEFVRLKPWRITLLEQQLKELSKHSADSCRSKYENQPKKCFPISSVLGKKEYKAELDLEKKRKRNRNRQIIENEDDDEEYPKVCSFKVSKSYVKLTDEQLQLLSKLKAENISLSGEESDFNLNEDGELIINRVVDKLNLKAFFLESLPYIPHYSFMTLTWVNLSFNNLSHIPAQLYLLSNMVSLNMRNNPVTKIPKEIKKLKKLRYLNFSFCMLTKINKGVYSLKELEVLDLSFNLITHVHKDIENLVSLIEFYVEGNTISVFPRSIMKLNLMSLYCESNFTHRCFWKESCPPVPQKLTDAAATILLQNGLISLIPEHMKNIVSDMSCANCGGHIVGKGVAVLKPVLELFGVRKLPLLFHVCSQKCRLELQLCEELPDIVSEND